MILKPFLANSPKIFKFTFKLYLYILSLLAGDYLNAFALFNIHPLKNLIDCYNIGQQTTLDKSWKPLHLCLNRTISHSTAYKLPTMQYTHFLGANGTYNFLSNSAVCGPYNLRPKITRPLAIKI